MLYKEYPDFYLFEEGLENLEIELDSVQKQQFIDYYELLIERNNVMNLTAITELKEVVTKHFIDSLSLKKVLYPNSKKVLDLGTGAGFPGIPLKIVYPDLEILLLDSLNKRINFLDEVINKLGLRKVNTLHGRAEDYGRDKIYREKFDICVSRAVAKLSSLSEYCLPFVKIGGSFISYKSGKIEEEIDEADHAIKILGAKVDRISNFRLMGTDIERTLVVIKKISNTPMKYPRSSGKPLRTPLK